MTKCPRQQLFDIDTFGGLHSQEWPPGKVTVPHSRIAPCLGFDYSMTCWPMPLLTDSSTTHTPSHSEENPCEEEKPFDIPSAIRYEIKLQLKHPRRPAPTIFLLPFSSKACLATQCSGAC